MQKKIKAIEIYGKVFFHIQIKRTKPKHVTKLGKENKSSHQIEVDPKYHRIPLSVHGIILKSEFLL